MQQRPFQPLPGASTTKLTASTSSGRTAFAIAPNPGVYDNQVRFHNAGTVLAFLRIDGSTVTAATTDMPLPAGAVEVLTVQGTDTYFAAITASGTADIY